MSEQHSPSDHPDLEVARLEIQRSRLELERRRDRREGRFIYAQFPALVTGLVALLGTSLTYLRYQELDTQRASEQLELQNQRAELSNRYAEERTSRTEEYRQKMRFEVATLLLENWPNRVNALEVLSVSYPAELIRPFTEGLLVSATDAERAPLQSVLQEVERRTDCEISFPATAPFRSEENSVKITSGARELAEFGANVLTSNTTSGLPNSAHYNFEVRCSGRYRLEIEYASAEPRPVSIMVDQQAVAVSALGETTGGWGASPSDWRVRTIGSVYLEQGRHQLSIYRSDHIPHFRLFRFVPL